MVTMICVRRELATAFAFLGLLVNSIVSIVAKRLLRQTRPEGAWWAGCVSPSARRCVPLCVTDPDERCGR